MSIYEHAAAELTAVAREAFMNPDWEMPENWMDTDLPAYGMTPRAYIEIHGEMGIVSLSNHIRGMAHNTYA